LDELDEFHPKSESDALLAIEIDGNGGRELFFVTSFLLGILLVYVCFCFLQVI
jgi:hypothetical protein